MSTDSNQTTRHAARNRAGLALSIVFGLFLGLVLADALLWITLPFWCVAP